MTSRERSALRTLGNLGMDVSIGLRLRLRPHQNQSLRALVEDLTLIGMPQ